VKEAAMSMHRLRAASAATLAVTVATLLTGCFTGGGGDDTPPTAEQQVPASAFASTSAFTDYIGTLVPTNTGEPLSLDRVDEAPTSETEEPVAL
jgi:hypothetical protein